MVNYSLEGHRFITHQQINQYDKKCAINPNYFHRAVTAYSEFFN